jgi:hypothetical protein
VSHDQPGQDNPSGGRDEFDHFFSDRGGSSAPRDPDATAWADASYDDRTQVNQHAPYVRPPEAQQYDEFDHANEGYYEPAGYYQEPPPRKSAMWAPVLVIVASLAIVAVVIAIILNNSNGRMAKGSFKPTATVTKTATPSTSQGQSSQSSSSSQSPSSPSSSPSSSHFATALPGSAASCPGSDSYGTGPKTTCSFAGVVSTLYEAKKNKAGDASFRAKSPATHAKYSVNCQANAYVTCTTETGAVVYILRN